MCQEKIDLMIFKIHISSNQRNLLKRVPPLPLKSSIFVVLFCLVCNAHSIAQNTKCHLAYSGNNLWNPGMKLNIFREINVKTLNQKNEKIEIRSHGINLDVGFYYDPGAYTALYSSIGYQSKVLFPNGRWIMTKVNPIGISRTFLPSTYHVQDDFTVSKVIFPGRIYYAPGLEFSWCPFRRNKFLTRTFIGADVQLLMPYNTYVLPIINIQVGYRLSKS